MPLEKTNFLAACMVLLTCTCTWEIWKNQTFFFSILDFLCWSVSFLFGEKIKVESMHKEFVRISGNLIFSWFFLYFCYILESRIVKCCQQLCVEPSESAGENNNVSAKESVGAKGFDRLRLKWSAEAKQWCLRSSLPMSSTMKN